MMRDFMLRESPELEWKLKKQLWPKQSAPRRSCPELNSLREALGYNAAHMLLFIFQAGGWVAGITSAYTGISQVRITKARKKLESYGLIRTTRHPGRPTEYQIIGKGDLEMLLPALEQWTAEREAAKQQGVPA